MNEIDLLHCLQLMRIWVSLLLSGCTVSSARPYITHNACWFIAIIVQSSIATHLHVALARVYFKHKSFMTRIKRDACQ